MQFDQFVQELDSAVHKLGADGARTAPTPTSATWTAGSRSVEIAELAPRNVSVGLVTGGKPVGTTWYPIDAALVPVVSRRIAGHLQGSDGVLP